MTNAQFSRRQAVAGLVATPVVLSMAHGQAAAARRDHVHGGTRRHIDLNHGWQFRIESNGSDWSRVDLPHTWNALDGQDGGGPPGGSGDYFRGGGRYRRELRVPAALHGKRLFLQFDGANTVTDVWIDGVHVGQHKGGYGRFRFDVTGVLTPGKTHELTIRVSNADNRGVVPLSADYTFFGGLYREVSLRVTEPVHVDLLDYAGPGVYLYQRAIQPARATVDVTTKLVNDDSTDRDLLVRTVVSDANGDVVQDASSAPTTVNAGARAPVAQTVHIDSPRLWNGRADPHCYSVAVEVRDARTDELLDTVTQPLGLRYFAIDPDEGFSLNGTPLPLRGVSRHQDRAGKGFAVADADHEQDLTLIHEMGANALRTAHYEQAQKVYDLTDSLGIAVYTEVPWVNAITDSDEFRADVKQQLHELIRQTYNHPSVLIWGIGNELGFHQRDKDPQTNALLADLAELIRTEDPSRESGYANVLARADDDPFTDHADLSGYNRYEGWYMGTADQIGTWADSLHARNPRRRIGITEYGAGANIHQHEQAQPFNPPDPSGPWHPEEYQALLHETYLKQIDARPYLWGTFVWNMFDFASDGRDEGRQPGINDKGLVTHDRRTRKDAFYWYKANWSPEPVLHITSSRWKQRTTPATIVRVYSNAESVTLTLNDQRLDTQRSDDRLFTWPVHLRPGPNTVTAQAVIDGVTYSDTVNWHLTPPH